jgi:hypothetical protein
LDWPASMGALLGAQEAGRPLSVEPDRFFRPAAIEVYPAGKLRANRLRAAGYRSPDAADLRSALLRELAGIYRLRPVVPPHQLVRNPPRLRRRDSEGRATAPLRAGRCGVEGGYGSRPRDTVGRTGTE